MSLYTGTVLVILLLVACVLAGVLGCLWNLGRRDNLRLRAELRKARFQVWQANQTNQEQACDIVRHVRDRQAAEADAANQRQQKNTIASLLIGVRANDPTAFDQVIRQAGEPS